MYPENQSSVQHYNLCNTGGQHLMWSNYLPKSAFISSNKYQLFLPPLSL